MVSPVSFNIVDSRSGKVVGTAKTRAGANRSVDKRDNAFGAYRYRAVAVWTMITLDQAFAILDAKRIAADYTGAQLFDCRTGENIAVISEGQVALEIIEAYAGA